MKIDTDTSVISVEQHSEIALHGKTPFHVHGHVNKGAGELVLAQVFVNVQVGKPDKNATHDMAIHEIPLARALQRMRGGSVDIIPSWVDPRTVAQVRGLTRSQAMDMLTRLRGQEDATSGPTMRGTYVHTYDDGTEVNCFNKVYGGENGQRHRLFDAMKAAHETWNAVCARARSEMRRLTVEDIEECVKACMPPDEADELSTIELDKVALNSATDSMTAGDGGMLEYLTEVAGVNDEVAAAFVAAMSKSPGASDLTDELWATIPGLAKGEPECAKKRKSLLARVTAFRSL
jgi:hypothetical protein